MDIRIQTYDKKYVVYCTTTSNDGDVSGNHGKSDIWLVKLGAENSVEDASSQTYQLWVYPNPSNGEVNMHVFQSEPVKQVHLYNILGIEYFPDYRVANYILNVDAQNLPTGSYIIRVQYLNNPRDEVKNFFHYR